MSNNKYGLDFTVWGNTAPKKVDSEPAPLKTLNRSNSHSSETKAPPAEDVDLSSTSAPPPVKQKPTCTLTNARFLPDATTDFNKPCTIVVDVGGKSAGPISFALWATYKVIEYDLQHVQSAFESGGKAQTTLKLFYVDEYYDDLYSRAEQDAVVEYFAVVRNKAAREIRSEVLKMPHFDSEGKILKAYFEDEEGSKTEITQTNQNIFLVLMTENLVGRKIDVELADADFDFEYNGTVLKNDTMENILVNSTIMRFPLKTRKVRP